MVVSDSGDCGGSQAPPPPPLPTFSSVKSTPKRSRNTQKIGHDQLLADIRNGITLKPTRTRDKSTPAYIKKSNGIKSTPSTPLMQQPTDDCSEAVGEMKDALQNELRNTLKRKVKVQDVERGDCTKQHEIEKAMEINRTEIKLKLNSSPPKTSPAPAGKKLVDEKPALSSPVLLRTLSKFEPTIDKKADKSTKELDLVNAIDLQRPPAKPQRAMHAMTTTSIESDKLPKKMESKEPPRVEISTFENSRAALYGTLRKVRPLSPLKIDVNTSRNGSLRNEILSPEVKSGYAAIRPSRIKTLTRQGSYVSHIDIVDGPKIVTKNPVLLVEPSQPTQLSPQPSNTNPSNRNQGSPRTPTRTTILDTKFSNSSSIKSPIIDGNTLSKKLLISHPKASFTLDRYTSRRDKASNTSYTSPATKPVFRILTDLEQAEQRETEQEQISAKQNGQKINGAAADKSYVSFAKELTNAPKNYPDTAVKMNTVGVVKKDLFFENINIRDIKIDIVENGQLKVVNK